MLLCDDTIRAIPNGASGVEIKDKDAADYFVNTFSEEWEHAVELVSQEQDDWLDQENPATVSETATGKLVLFTPLWIWFMDVYCDTDKGIDAVQNAIVRMEEQYPDTKYRGCIQFEWSDEVGGDVVKFDLSSEDSNEPYSFVGEILKRVVNDKRGEFWERIKYSNYIQEIEKDLKIYKDWVGDEALNRIAAISHGKTSKALNTKSFGDYLMEYHGDYPRVPSFYKNIIDSMNDE